MTTKTLLRAIKARKPVVIREKGEPRYVMLNWDTYEKMEELEDRLRLMEALRDPKNQKKVSYSRVKKLLRISKI